MPEPLQIKSNICDYTVTFGPTEAQLARDLAGPCAVIIDERVAELYADRLGPLLEGKPVHRLHAVESNKNMEYSQRVIAWLMENGFKRTHLLVAIGGGITQDLTCFTASILFRGVRWAFYPTTLLAQCDSCIGSKSSINVDRYKNQVGTFYPPESITVDVGFTRTLDPRDILSGLGEAIKVHYLDADQRFERIFEHYAAAVDDPSVLETVIYDSLLIKKAVIEVDEFDRDYRNIMNYGHTFGHALESVTDYALPHGIAVTAGMGVANYVSKSLGFLDEGTHDRMLKLIRQNIGEHRVGLASYDAYWQALQRDKKNVDGDVTCILTKGFGEMFRHKLALTEDVRGHIRRGFETVGVLAP